MRALMEGRVQTYRQRLKAQQRQEQQEAVEEGISDSAAAELAELLAGVQDLTAEMWDIAMPSSWQQRASQCRLWGRCRPRTWAC